MGPAVSWPHALENPRVSRLNGCNRKLICLNCGSSLSSIALDPWIVLRFQFRMFSVFLCHFFDSFYKLPFIYFHREVCWKFCFKNSFAHTHFKEETSILRYSSYFSESFCDFFNLHSLFLGRICLYSVGYPYFS